jgi:N-hydroxyarylamine O-acetyltransferase
MSLDLDAYFRRIGYAGLAEPTLATLAALQARHPLAIPFENLDAFAGVPVRLDLDSLQRKLVAARRGGYCFEQNTLFAAVLERLGFAVTALAARVVWERPAGEVRARSHMLVLVALEGGDYICDVGFGGLTPTAPLRLEANIEQSTPHETFRVLRGAREFGVEARVRGEWKPLYRFDLQPQAAVDIEQMNFYVMAHVESPMLGRVMAARAAADRRHALRNGTLASYALDGTEVKRDLPNVAALRAALTDVFGIDVPRGDALDASFARLLAQ